MQPASEMAGSAVAVCVHRLLRTTFFNLRLRSTHDRRNLCTERCSSYLSATPSASAIAFSGAVSQLMQSELPVRSLIISRPIPAASACDS